MGSPSGFMAAQCQRKGASVALEVMHCKGYTPVEMAVHCAVGLRFEQWR